MILAVDVHYHQNHALAAAVIFNDWSEASPVAEITTPVQDVSDYVPGQFYRRELPCIQKILAQQPYDLKSVIVDGYVYLGREQKPGLGKHLWDALKGQVPIIGVAKNLFRGTPAESELRRGTSQKPLYVTSVGIELSSAKAQVAAMHGPHRIPTLLKRVDALCRQSA